MPSSSKKTLNHPTRHSTIVSKTKLGNGPLKRIAAVSAVLPVETKLSQKAASLDRQIEAARNDEQLAEKNFLEARGRRCELEWERTGVTVELHKLGVEPPLADDDIPVGDFNLKHAIKEYKKKKLQLKRELENAESADDSKRADVVKEKIARLKLFIPLASGLRRYGLLKREWGIKSAIAAATRSLSHNITRYRETERTFHLWESFSAAAFLSRFGVLVPSVEYTSIFLPKEVARYLEQAATPKVRSDLASNREKYLRADEVQRKISEATKNKQLNAGQLRGPLKTLGLSERTIQRHLKRYKRHQKTEV